MGSGRPKGLNMYGLKLSLSGGGGTAEGSIMYGLTLRLKLWGGGGTAEGRAACGGLGRPTSGWKGFGNATRRRGSPRKSAGLVDVIGRVAVVSGCTLCQFPRLGSSSSLSSTTTKSLSLMLSLMATLAAPGMIRVSPTAKPAVAGNGWSAAEPETTASGKSAPVGKYEPSSPGGLADTGSLEEPWLPPVVLVGRTVVDPPNLDDDVMAVLESDVIPEPKGVVTTELGSDAVRKPEDDVIRVPEDVIPVPKDVIPELKDDVIPVPKDDVVPELADIIPVPEDDVTPVPKDDVIPVPEDVIPVLKDDATPAPKEDVMPAPEDVIPVLEDAVMPELKDEVMPAPKDVVIPVPEDVVIPELKDDVIPVPKDDIMPAPEDVLFELKDDVIPVPKDNVIPEPEAVIPVPEDVTPVPKDDVIPVPGNEVFIPFTVDSKTATSEVMAVLDPEGLLEPPSLTLVVVDEGWKDAPATATPSMKEVVLEVVMVTDDAELVWKAMLAEVPPRDVEAVGGRDWSSVTSLRDGGPMSSLGEVGPAALGPVVSVGLMPSLRADDDPDGVGLG